jgi:peptidoglycan L-alanyl-D-glutamate endopeptidase CwlK
MNAVSGPLLSPRSEKNLVGVHPDLVRVVRRTAAALQDANADIGFVVIEGLRTKTRQAALVKAGASWTMNSRHLTGHAVDLMATVSGVGRWDWALYDRLAIFVKQAAVRERVAIAWGGDWKLRDGPHFELSRAAYKA